MPYDKRVEKLGLWTVERKRNRADLEWTSTCTVYVTDSIEL